MRESKLPQEYFDMAFSMSEFQIKHFVVGSQHNPYRQFKQILLELEVRYTNIEQMELDMEKVQLEGELLLEKINSETSPAQKKLYELELKRNKIQHVNGLTSIQRSYDEVAYLEKIHKEFREKVDIKELMEHQDEHEHDYWIKRMATQSALELLTVGRIGVGNLEALMQMGPDNFRKALAETTKITNEVKEQVKYLDMVAEHEQLEAKPIKEIDIK